MECAPVVSLGSVLDARHKKPLITYTENPKFQYPPNYKLFVPDFVPTVFLLLQTVRVSHSKLIKM
jgi:hypothetical protein